MNPSKALSTFFKFPIFLIFILSACGGSTSNDRPTPTPTPTPTPPPVTNLVNMTGTQSFKAWSTLMGVRNNGTTIIFNETMHKQADVIVDNNANTIKLVLTHDVNPGDETVEIDQTLDFDTDVSIVVDGIAAAAKALPDGRIFSLGYVIPGELIPTVGTLENVTGGMWLMINQNTNDIDGGFVVAGFETEDSEIPRSGSASYDIIAEALIVGGGYAYDGVGSGSLNASFSTGELTGSIPTFNLYDFDGNLLDTMAGFTMTGSISSNENFFDGTTHRDALDGIPELNGFFGGQFYGPNAAEIGGVFNLYSGGSSAISDYTLVGGFIGKK